MKITYSQYKFFSSFIGEILILISQFLNFFYKNKYSSFIFKRSHKNIVSSKSSKKKIWFYASSVGEVGVCEIVIKEMLNLKKNLSFHISIMTDSGYEIASSNFASIADISYSPLDSYFNVKKTFEIIKPDLLCIIETELWPNLIYQANKNKIPIIVTNARISNSSLKNYSKTKDFSKYIINLVDKFYASSFQDEKNLIKLSCKKEKIIVTGNAKYDFKIDKSQYEKTKTTYKNFFGFKKTDLIFVCGSTREGEEEILIPVFKKLKNEFKNLKLVLVPRHLTRLDEVKNVFLKNNLSFGLRTENTDKPYESIIIDTMGELKKIYSIADLVFVGGSLLNFGGQNILEPAALEKPVIFGKHMDDFKEISKILLNEKGGFEVSESNINEVIKKLLENNELRKISGQNAFQVVKKNRGAGLKQAKGILGYLS
ncbi:MAG: glycosyltransferase N-terminal domain-containing protein [Desulforegulaceae bacterium]|nr:glycosyltransferase N-terminal domain-containing protein [Desulforegulaceae bacterium]